MKQCLIDFSLRHLRVAKASITLFFIADILAITLFPGTAVALLSQATRNTLTSSHSYIGTLPIMPSPTEPNTTATTSSDSQAQQVLSEAQNDVTIATLIITFTGVFVSIVAVAVAIVGFLEIRGYRGIQQLRTEVEGHLQQVSNLEKQVDRQLEQFNSRFEEESRTFENQFEGLAKRFEKEGQIFEERLEELTKHFESQTFMEASYNFGVATDAYKVGDNERAIEYYLLVLRSQPNNITVMERLGRAYSNLNDMENAVYYLERARTVDPRNVPALRSLALCYRYNDREKAISFLNEALTIDPHDYESWDFLGLIYRDGGLIDKAIYAHEQALAKKRRPETQFYLSILYSLKGDRTRAKLMALTAHDDAQKKEFAERLRPVWRILIDCSVYIIENNEEESLRIIQTLTPYITTKRIYDSLTGHLELLLAATGHKEWTAKFMEIVKVRGT